MPDIFITGCAKTRTTLVQWLFSAFKNCVIIPSESSLYVFRHNLLHYIMPEINLVAKRMYGSILTGKKLYYEEYSDQVSRVSTDNIKLVEVKRNREDTLKSENGYVPPERYDYWKKESGLMKPIVAAVIDSDELLQKPNKAQEKVAADLGFEIEHQWSTWPEFAPRQQMVYIDYPKIFQPFERI